MSSKRARFLLDHYYGDQHNPVLSGWYRDQLIDDPSIWPLVLYGPSGVGKTSLAETLLCRLSDRGTSCLKLTGADFRRCFLASLQTKSTADFRRQFSKTAALLIDDLSSIGEDTCVQRELVQIIDWFAGARRPLLFTQKQSPLVDSSLDEPLRSRLSGGLVVAVRPAGLPARRQMVIAVARRLNLELKPEDLDWMVDKLPRSLPLIHRELSRLALVGSAKSIPLSSVQIRDWLGQRPSPSGAPLPQIASLVAKHCMLSVRQLRGSARHQQIVHARSLGMYLARHTFGLPYDLIGKYFGGRDQSTVRHACKRVGRWLADEPMQIRLVNSLEDTLQQKLDGYY